MAQLVVPNRIGVLVSEDELYAYIKARCSCATEALHLFEVALEGELICLSGGSKKTLIKPVIFSKRKLLVSIVTS